MAAKKSPIAALAHQFDGHVINVSADTRILYMFAMGKDVAVASVNTYKGKTALDIRRFYFSAADQFEATGKGIRVPLEQAESLVQALDAASKDGAFRA